MAAEHSPSIPIVLIDIVGGQLGEGVNFKGKQMEAAALIGIPYPDVSGELQRMKLRIERLTEITGNPVVAEGLAFRYTAIRKLAQTAGRVHRSETDRGCIVFLDERILGIRTVRENGYHRFVRRNAQATSAFWDILQGQIRQTIRPVAYMTSDWRDFSLEGLTIPGVGYRELGQEIDLNF